VKPKPTRAAISRSCSRRGRCAPNQVKVQRLHEPVRGRRVHRRLDDEPPIYKPEFWDKVQELDMWTNKYDPCSRASRSVSRARARRQDPSDCQRRGLPVRGGGRRRGQLRSIALSPPTAEARSREVPGRVLLGTCGRTLGRRHLVIDSIAFNDLTWLDKGGYFHSDKMRAIERFTREGTPFAMRSRSRTRRCSPSRG
jgi:hypothetical protein